MKKKKLKPMIKLDTRRYESYATHIQRLGLTKKKADKQLADLWSKLLKLDTKRAKVADELNALAEELGTPWRV